MCRFHMHVGAYAHRRPCARPASGATLPPPWPWARGRPKPRPTALRCRGSKHAARAAHPPAVLPSGMSDRTLAAQVAAEAHATYGQTITQGRGGGRGGVLFMELVSLCVLAGGGATSQKPTVTYGQRPPQGRGGRDARGR